MFDAQDVLGDLQQFIGLKDKNRKEIYYENPELLVR